MKSSIKTKLDEKAYRRDGFACVECGRTHGIEAHHIIPNLEKLENLITLCHACHKKHHNMAGCFKKGFDLRRAVPDRNHPGVQFLIKRTKKEYFNRWVNKWVPID